MLDNAGGMGGIKTVIRTLEDGGTARLQVQNGLARFIVDHPVAETVEDCVKGPFAEQEQANIDYEARQYYDGAKVWAWGNLAYAAITALKYLVVEGLQRKRMMFVFRWQNEPEPGDLPLASVKFQEEDFSAREYYAESDSIMLPATLRPGLVYARFKAVVAPIKRITCLKGMVIEFAEKGTSGDNPVTQGCVKKTLAERFEDTRVFVGDWLKSIFFTTGTGGASVTVLDEKGFLTPVGTGDKLACADIPAIGTRVIGVRYLDTVYLDTGVVRPRRDYERADSPALVWLRSRGSVDTGVKTDRFGNVEGLLWRPGDSPVSYGPDVCVWSPSYPYIRHFLRVNSDDSVWLVERTVSTGTTFSFYATPVAGGDGQALSTTITLTSKQTAALALTTETQITVVDVSKHGDKVLYAWLDISEQPYVPLGPVIAMEVTFVGDFPNATISSRWVLEEPTTVPANSPVPTVYEQGHVIGVYIDDDTDETRWVLRANKSEFNYTAFSWDSSGGGGSSVTSGYDGFASCPAFGTPEKPYQYYLSVTTSTVKTWTVFDTLVTGEGSLYLYQETGSITITDAQGSTVASSISSSPPNGSYLAPGSKPAVVGTEWGRYSLNWNAVLFMGPKLLIAGIGFGSMDRLAISAGVPTAPNRAVNCTVKPNGSVRGDDSISPMAMRNPVDGSVAFVGVETNGFLAGWYNKLNFV